MAYCSNCGKPVLEGARFCANCGFKLENGQEMPASKQYENYITLAYEAMDSENWQEGQRYASRILEMNPQDSEAWKIKMFAAEALERDYTDLHTAEVIRCGQNCLKYSSEEDFSANAKTVYSFFFSIGNSLLLKAFNTILELERRNGEYILGEMYDLAMALSKNALDYRLAVYSKQIVNHIKEADLFLSRYVLFYATVTEIFKCNDISPDRQTAKDFADLVTDLGEALPKSSLDKYTRVIKKTMGSWTPNMDYLSSVVGDMLY